MVFTPEFETETASDLAGLVLEIHQHLARDLVLSWRYGLRHVLQPLSLALPLVGFRVGVLSIASLALHTASRMTMGIPQFFLATLDFQERTLFVDAFFATQAISIKKSWAHGAF